MQAGSTFKVFTLIAALSQDEPISTKTQYDGKSPQYFEEFEDSAAGTEEERTGRSRTSATSSSAASTCARPRATRSTPSTPSSTSTSSPRRPRLRRSRGPARRRDRRGPQDDTSGANYANVFGTDVVTVRDMANAYATIAAQGVRATPYFIKTVKGGPGDLDYKVKISKKPVFDKDVMADTIDAMQEPIEDGTAEFAQGLGRPAAGKTGTTSGNYAAWFDGYTPQLATAVGIYKGSGAKAGTVSMSDLPGSASSPAAPSRCASGPTT